MRKKEPTVDPRLVRSSSAPHVAHTGPTATTTANTYLSRQTISGTTLSSSSGGLGSGQWRHRGIAEHRRHLFVQLDTVRPRALRRFDKNTRPLHRQAGEETPRPLGIGRPARISRPLPTRWPVRRSTSALPPRRRTAPRPLPRKRMRTPTRHTPPRGEGASISGASSWGRWG